MVRGTAIAAILAALAGCGSAKVPPATPPSGTPAPAASSNFSMWGSMRLAFFDDALGTANPKPSFEVTSPQCKLLGENLWQIEDAQAKLYGRDNAEHLLHSANARFDGVSKSATLGGGVTLETGTYTIEMEEITWIDSEREARTDHPVTITGQGMTMRAEGMRLRPDPGPDPTQYIQLHKVQGSFEFSGKDES